MPPTLAMPTPRAPRRRGWLRYALIVALPQVPVLAGIHVASTAIAEIDPLYFGRTPPATGPMAHAADRPSPRRELVFKGPGERKPPVLRQVALYRPASPQPRPSPPRRRAQIREADPPREETAAPPAAAGMIRMDACITIAGEEVCSVEPAT